MLELMQITGSGARTGARGGLRWSRGSGPGVQQAVGTCSVASHLLETLLPFRRSDRAVPLACSIGWATDILLTCDF